MTAELGILATTAASLGLLHTLIGPDHYLPFIALAGARRWSLRRTLGITAVCGAGHVLGSLLLGAVGIGLGWAVAGLAWVESVRGELVAWLLIGFGLAYTAWGLRQAARGSPHSHWHSHANGRVHLHSHSHSGSHAHPHPAASGNRLTRGLTPWVLFTLFVFGPCEPLIPLLMVPAVEHSWWGIGLVAAIFGGTTVATMLVVVAVGYLGTSRLRLGGFQRFAHALAGLALLACGLAIRLGL